MNWKGRFATGALAFLLAAGAAQAQVVVHVAPPPPVVERPGPVPSGGWVWVGGHHRWDGRRYVWVPGHYVRPPRPHAVWIPGRWVPRQGGYVYVAGHWR